MKKTFSALMILLLMSFSLVGCSKKLDFNIIQYEFDSMVYEKVLSNEYYQIQLKDSSGYEFGYFCFQGGQVNIDDDRMMSMENNADFILCVNLNKEVSGKNLKCYYNGSNLDLTKNNSVDNIYEFKFKSATEHQFKIEGLSKEIKRMMSVTLPVSTEDYDVIYNSGIINDSNNDIEIEYNKELEVRIAMKKNVDPSWILAYQKEDSYYFGEEDNVTKINHNNNSRTYKIIMDYNIIKMEVLGVVYNQ